MDKATQVQLGLSQGLPAWFKREAAPQMAALQGTPATARSLDSWRRNTVNAPVAAFTTPIKKHQGSRPGSNGHGYGCGGEMGAIGLRNGHGDGNSEIGMGFGNDLEGSVPGTCASYLPLYFQRLLKY